VSADDSAVTVSPAVADAGFSSASGDGLQPATSARARSTTALRTRLERESLSSTEVKGIAARKE